MNYLDKRFGVYAMLFMYYISYYGLCSIIIGWIKFNER